MLIEDLMRIANDLVAGHDEVNAFLLDQVVNRLLDAVGSCDRRRVAITPRHP